MPYNGTKIEQEGVALATWAPPDYASVVPNCNFVFVCVIK